MRVLIIGSGGREHALAWKVAQSATVEKVYVAPGNAGTGAEPGVENVPIGVDALDALVEFAQSHAIDLTLVGPEVPLVDGIADLFAAQGLQLFGPSAAAAQLEGSKDFGKRFMLRHKIRTPQHRTFTQLQSALDYLDTCTAPIVIKADGLAAGKGVIIADSLAQARQAVESILSARAFGAAGECVLIETCIVGTELSYICLADGRDWVPLASARDYKRSGDNDCGLNTGGMGGYSPSPLVDADLHRRIGEQIVQPTLDGMADEGTPFRGFLYSGLMVDAQGELWVLEYNVRLGDPETQLIMMRLISDLPALCLAACQGNLSQMQTQWDTRAAVGVVLASVGYPGAYPVGAPIVDEGEDASDAKVFHAGTAQVDGRLVSAGGRVLCAVGMGQDLSAARQRAYQRVANIACAELYCRNDIAASDDAPLAS